MGKEHPHLVAAGNRLVGPEVLDAAASAFHATTGSLTERLLAALQAGEAAGGGRLGHRSADQLQKALEEARQQGGRSS